MGILIVDDSRIDRMILRDLLESEGHTVDESENGEEALHAAFISLPDLIISDILMPVMDGFSLCKSIRSDERTSYIPFVFYTATYTTDEDETLGIKIGADGFYRKSMGWDDFYAAVKVLIHGTPKNRRIPKQFSDQEEADLYKLYNERLIKKIEDKVFELEKEILWRKNIEVELRESRQHLELAIEGANIGIWNCDIATGSCHFFGKWVENFGYKRDEIVPCCDTLEKLLHPDDRKTVLNVLKANLKGENRFFENEHRILDASGNCRWILSRGMVVEKDVYGNPLRQAGTVIEISERKHAEETREKLQAQLIQAQKMESIGRLAGGVAHDFNNMLAIVLGYTELALEKVEPGHPIFTDLQEVRKAAERSSDLTRQLLAFARQQVAEPKVIDLNATVEGILKMLQRLIGENIDLAWKPQTGLWPVHLDPGQVDQILANLCVNACDAIHDGSGGGGRITLETANSILNDECPDCHTGIVPGEYVSLIVSDDGRGMDRETADKIFEPFFTTKEIGMGTGLGLSTVYGIVRQNNGFIHVFSEPGKGAMFKIHLPRYKARAAQTRQGKPAGPAAKSRETILLVEDEPAILKMTKTILERLDYHVLAAVTPGEAIGLARQHTGDIHLLMTDVVMPEMNGRDLAKNLTSLYPAMKLLFMSGFTADIIAHQGVIDQGLTFIRKPFSMKDLAVKLREAIEGP